MRNPDLPTAQQSQQLPAQSQAQRPGLPRTNLRPPGQVGASQQQQQQPGLGAAGNPAPKVGISPQKHDLDLVSECVFYQRMYLITRSELQGCSCGCPHPSVSQLQCLANKTKEGGVVCGVGGGGGGSVLGLSKIRVALDELA